MFHGDLLPFFSYVKFNVQFFNCRAQRQTLERQLQVGFLMLVQLCVAFVVKDLQELIENTIAEHAGR